MASYKLISADSHIVEPPDLYTSRIEPRFRAPNSTQSAVTKRLWGRLQPPGVGLLD